MLPPLVRLAVSAITLVLQQVPVRQKFIQGPKEVIYNYVYIWKINKQTNKNKNEKEYDLIV